MFETETETNTYFNPTNLYIVGNVMPFITILNFFALQCRKKVKKKQSNH